jgi:hypothetical protein
MVSDGILDAVHVTLMKDQLGTTSGLLLFLKRFLYLGGELLVII